MDSMLPRLKWPLYLLAIVLIVSPLADFATSVLPLSPTDIKWRFATVALFSGFLFTPLLALALIVVVAALVEDRPAQRVVSVVSLVMVALLLVLLAAFLLDVLQLRQQTVGDDERLPFDLSVIRSLVRYGLTTCVLLWLGVATWRTSRRERSSRSSRGEVPLVSTQV